VADACSFIWLESTVISMAEPQMKTEGHSFDLLPAWDFDESMEAFEKNASELFD
jgi:hypothetical protein